MTRTPQGHPAFVACRLVVGGRVQGVGFRPFVYRAARRHGVHGWVRNTAGEVEIVAQGSPEGVDSFRRALLAEAPPLARPALVSERPAAPQPVSTFEIRASDARPAQRIHVPPDQFACDDCLTELGDPGDRRFRYPFINCTQCGPRWTLIERLPYDRANTSMAGFPLCPQCSAEYADPGDRRFHAEPLACPRCGPGLALRSAAGTVTGEAALAAAVAVLRAGGIAAVKGVGGYHLMCAATDPRAVATLRLRKHRPAKPLAVMFPLQADLAALRRATVPAPVHEAMLRDPVRPIVLVPKHPHCDLADGVAPGCAEIGAMLPYSPLHHLLLGDFGGALVATSGNLGGEPVVTGEADAEARLGSVADAFLHHDRVIVRPADDAVYRIIGGTARPLRLGRGSAPLEIALPFALERPLLALGGQLKNTVALAFADRAVVSPHLADMDTPRGLQLLERVAADLQSLYGVAAEAVICDAHPGYATTRAAPRFGRPVVRVFHHDAHASALAGEFPGDAPWLVFTWDGAGFGRDGAIWGGEALLGRPGRWRRVATLRPFALPGGDRAAREPWRSALALCWEAGLAWPCGGRDVTALHHAWTRRLNCPVTSSAGRLFDGAAAVLDLAATASYEGEAAVRLEAACAGEAQAVALPLARRSDGVLQSDWEPLLRRLLAGGAGPPQLAAVFHETLAAAVLDQAKAIRRDHGAFRLGLTGGVFQNRVLCERVMSLARRDGFAVFTPQLLPCNDAGLSFGQIVEAGAHDRR